MRQTTHAIAQDIGENAGKMVYVWAIAAIVPAFTSLLWLAFVPPLWPGTDSTSILLWPRGIVPHYPVLYPGIIEVFEYAFGVNPSMLILLLIAQHIALIMSIIYLSSSFQRKIPALVLSIVALAGTWFASFAHGVATQASELPFLVLLMGVTLRFYVQGWRIGLLPMLAIAVLGLSLSRHASIVLAIVVPIYWLVLSIAALLRRQPARQYLAYAAVCVGIVSAAFIASVAVTQLSCSVLKRDCTSVLGRAGYYRIYETYNLVPTSERTAWIGDKTKGLSSEMTFAFNAMATDTSGGWGVARDTVAKQFPTLNPDWVMNGAFVRFLLSPDKYSLNQMSSELGGGLYLVKSRYMTEQMLGWFFGNTINLLSAPVTFGDGHGEMRVRLGARGATDAAFLQTLPIDGFVRAYDWYTFHLLNGVAVLLFVLVLILVRDDRTNALLASFFVTGLIFLIAESTVTVILSHYVQPVNLMMYLSTGICSLVLIEWLVNS